MRLIDGQNERYVRHDGKQSIRPISQLKRELLCGHRWYVEKDRRLHRSVEHASKRACYDRAHQCVVSAARANCVQIGKIWRTQVYHIDALHAYIGKRVGRRLRVRVVHQLSCVRPARNRVGVAARDAHSDVGAIVHDSPRAWSGRRQSTLDRRSESSAVVVRLRNRNRARRGADKDHNGVIYARSNGRDHHRNPDKIDSPSTTTSYRKRLRQLNGEVCRCPRYAVSRIDEIWRILHNKWEN